MNKRKYLLLGVLLTLLIIQFIIPLIFKPLVENNSITDDLYYLTFFGLVTAISIGISIYIIKEGEYVDYSLKLLGWFLLISAAFDFYRIIVYPKPTLGFNVFSFFASIAVLMLSAISIRKAVYNKSMGVFFLFIGVITLVRFPFFIDLIYFYINKYNFIVGHYESYYFLTLYINYAIVILELLILNSIFNENKNMLRYR